MNCCYFGEQLRDDKTYRCGNPGCDRVRVTDFAPWQLHYRCTGQPVRRAKPGSELVKLNQQLNIQPKPGCTCAKLARRMNALGVEGCRQHRDELLGELRKNYQLYGAKDKLTAAVNAIATGVAFRIDPRDPLGSLFDEALRRAAAVMVPPAAKSIRSHP